MSLSDPLGDMLTRIRNGQAANKTSIKSPASKLRMNVLEVLRREGYIRGYEREKDGLGAVDRVEIPQRRAGDSRDQAGSKPGRRVYSTSRICRGSTTGSASRSCPRRAA